MPSSVDRTLIDGGFWDRATFTVPADISYERVRYLADDCKRRAGEEFERQGFTVKQVFGPIVSLGKLPVDEDRTRYDIFFFLSREPVELTYEIPDILVPVMEQKGLKQK